MCMCVCVSLQGPHVVSMGTPDMEATVAACLPGCGTGLPLSCCPVGVWQAAGCP